MLAIMISLIKLMQNQNESRNFVAWSRCSKRLLFGILRFVICVSQFNYGEKERIPLTQEIWTNKTDIGFTDQPIVKFDVPVVTNTFVDNGDM